MKQYKHKKLDIIINEEINWEIYYYNKWNKTIYLEKELIENSQDWEEIKEDIFQKIHDKFLANDEANSYKELKYAIQDCIWITREEIKNLSVKIDFPSWNNQDLIFKHDVIELFQNRWLLIN